MALRLLIIAQITWIAVVGAETRGILGASSMPTVIGLVIALTLYPVLIGFPIAVWFAARRAGLPTWKRRVLLGIEAALGYATFLALLPAVQ